MAGSCYPSYFASESAVYRLSDACLIRGTGASNFFSSCCAVETSLDVLLLNLGLAKTQLYGILSSCMLRAIRLVLGVAVAI